MQQDCQRDLDLAQPKLDSAKAAVEKLDKTAIIELKSMNKLPPGVDVVTDATMVLLGKPTGWEKSARQQMNVPE